MKVSIITVSFNAAETIEDTLKSVSAQTHPDIEHIVIDGGSTDGTLAIIERYARGIATFISEPDKGIYDAMNKGLAYASGDIVGILNSDDTYAYQDVISDIVHLMKETGAAAAYADLQYVQRANPDKVVRHWRSGEYRVNEFIKGWMPPHPTFFLQKSAYEIYGFFRDDLRSSADYELMLRMLYKYRLSACYLPKVTVKMKMGGQSNASVSNRLKAREEDKKAWRVNDLKPAWYTIWMKPLRKLGQFIRL